MTEPRVRLAASGIVVHDGALLLVQRGRPPSAGKWSIPGGHVEFGEHVRETVAREVREETGLEIADLKLLSVGNYVFNREDGERHYIDVDFVCEAPAGEPQLAEPEKCDGWDWYDLDDLPQPLFIVTRRMIESLRSGVTINSLSEIERQ